jgi:hypothetical protein
MSTAIGRFIRYWRTYTPEAPPFVHPKDATYAGISSLELQLLPVPAIGDIEHAEVIVLMLNPGLHKMDFTWEKKPEYRDIVLRNLHQKLEGVRHPFFYLDSRFSEHPGALYWIGGNRLHSRMKVQQKLRAVALELARRRNSDFAAAQAEISRRVAIVQQVPYHSHKLRKRSLLRTLHSCTEARLLAKALVEETDKLVVIVRSSAEWGFTPQVKQNLVVYNSSLGASASLTLRSLGGQAILNRLLTGDMHN